MFSSSTTSSGNSMRLSLITSRSICRIRVPLRLSNCLSCGGSLSSASPRFCSNGSLLTATGAFSLLLSGGTSPGIQFGSGSGGVSSRSSSSRFGTSSAAGSFCSLLYSKQQALTLCCSGQNSSSSSFISSRSMPVSS